MEDLSIDFKNVVHEDFNKNVVHEDFNKNVFHEDFNIYAFGEGLPLDKNWVRFSFDHIKSYPTWHIN
jgi:hypothetical protein